MAKKTSVRLPSATSLVARSYPDKIIGVENRLPWHLGTDLRHFKERTVGHAIIMGRKTFESIGRPLPKRLSIVLSRTELPESDSVKWARNPETALLLADQYSIFNIKKEFFVVGGEQIYDIFDKFINIIYLTDVFCGPINGDAKFDRHFHGAEWYFRYEREFKKSDIDDFPFRISCIVRRRLYHRYASRNELNLSSDAARASWEAYSAMMAQSDADDIVDVSQLSFLAQL